MLSNHRTVRRLVVGLSLVVPVAIQAQSTASQPLRPGDRVVVFNPADSTRREEFDIDPAGRVFLPRIGVLVVTGIPATDLGDSVRARYRRIQKIDDVYVQLLRRVSVSGEVHAPGVYFIEPGLNLRDAVAKAGGVGELGKTCCLTIVRQGQRLPLTDWQLRAEAELPVHSGDAIVIEREPWIKRNVFSLISGFAVLLSSLVVLSR